MFQKRCAKCREKLAKNFQFCPHCGSKVHSSHGGLLDEINESMLEDLFSMRMPAGFDGLFKELSKSLQEVKKETKDGKETKKLPGISITVSSVNGENPKIQVRTFPGGGKEGTHHEHQGHHHHEVQKQNAAFFHSKLSAEELEKFSQMEKAEPETKVRRLTDKVVYEINLPGITSLEKVAINKMQNSIEIKALAKGKAYFKLIPVSLPVNKYYLKEERLILELAAQY